MSAVRKKKSGGRWLLFWLVFFIGITLLFMANMESIKNSLKETRILEKLFNRSEKEPDEYAALTLEQHIQDIANASGDPGLAEGVAVAEQAAPPNVQAQPAGAASQAEIPVKKESNGLPPVPGKPDSKGNTVERAVYFMKLDTAGAILQANVKRNLPASDSPLVDALEALIKGPSAAEEKQGLISLIPKNVKIQYAEVQGNTAYISFSEDFLFNTYGVEGYAGQRRQIVLTATEFSNVKDVQILIDRKRVDYLGEGIWIGSPVSRNML